MSEQVKKLETLQGKGGGSAHPGTRGRFAYTYLALLDAGAPLGRTLTWSPMQSPMRPRLGGRDFWPRSNPAASSRPCSLQGEGTVSPRNQFLVLWHPLTHPSTTNVFKLLARYPLPRGFKIVRLGKQKIIIKKQRISNSTFPPFNTQLPETSKELARNFAALADVRQAAALASRASAVTVTLQCKHMRKAIIFFFLALSGLGSCFG